MSWMQGRREEWWRPSHLGLHPMHRMIWVIAGATWSVLNLLWMRQRGGKAALGWLFGTHFLSHAKGNKHRFAPFSPSRGQRWCRHGLHIFRFLVLMWHRILPVFGWLLRFRLIHPIVFTLHKWWPVWIRILLLRGCVSSTRLALIFQVSQPLSGFIVGLPRIVWVFPPLGHVFFSLPLLLLAFCQAEPGRERWWARFWQASPLLRLFSPTAWVWKWLCSSCWTLGRSCAFPSIFLAVLLL